MQVSIFAAALGLAACAAEHVDVSARALSGPPVSERPALVDVSAEPGFLEDPPPLWNPLIVGGAPVNSDPAVALLLAVDAGDNILGICSGTLIAPTRVLTAAHCLDGSIPGVAGIGVYFGAELSDTDPDFLFLTSAEQVVVHPLWNPDRLEDGNDVGLVFLREAPPIQPIPIRTAPLTAADVGAPIELVGWGLTGGGAGDSGVKRFAASTLRAVDELLIDVGDASVGTCSGDSGGPAFLGGEVVGVTSFGDVDCQQLSIDTRVDAFKTFIASDGQQLDRPGAGPGAGDFGAACDDADACASGVCLIGDAGGFCSELCDLDAAVDACPAQTACTDFDGTAACAPGGDDGPGGGFPPLADDEGGCSAAGAGGSPGALLLLALFGVARRRRRRR